MLGDDKELGGGGNRNGKSNPEGDTDGKALWSLVPPEYRELTESNLISLTQAGDEEAFAALVLRYRRRLLGKSLEWCLDEGEAEELTDDIQMAVWQGRHGFQGRSQFGTWLFRIATTQGYKWVRKRKRRPPEESLETRKSAKGPQASLLDPHSLTDMDAGPLEEVCEIVRKAVRHLREPRREIIELYFFQDCTTQEVAEALELTEIQVRKERSRAYNELKTKLLSACGGNKVVNPPRTLSDS